MPRPIEATCELKTSLIDACDALRLDPAAVLGRGDQARRPGTFVAELAMPVGGAGSVGERIEVEILTERIDDHHARWDLAWKAIGPAGLFPRFRGSLIIEDGPRPRLRLVGAYEPPLGAAGRFGDGLLGHRIARRSLDDFVEHVADRIATVAAVAATARATPTRVVLVP